MADHGPAVMGRGLRCGPFVEAYQKPIETAFSSGGGASVIPSIADATISSPRSEPVAVTDTVAVLLRGQCTTRRVQPSPAARLARSVSLTALRSTSTPGGRRVASSRTLVRSLVTACGWAPVTNDVSARA